jgi:Cu(I)/Ag(I) efflux system periplasmic protein CusF
MRARLPILAAILVLAIAGPAAAQAPAAKPAGDMKGMAMPQPSGRSGKGTGVVVGVDRDAGTVTLKHQPIPALGWPSMTMDFKATPPSLLDGLKVGQKIAFDANEGNGVPLITGIRKP